jgi:hypothetical protein
MSHEVHDEIEDHEEFFSITRSSCPSIHFAAFVVNREH